MRESRLHPLFCEESIINNDAVHMICVQRLTSPLDAWYCEWCVCKLCMSVRLTPCSHISKTSCPNFAKLSIYLYLACDDSAVCCVRPVLWRTSWVCLSDGRIAYQPTLKSIPQRWGCLETSRTVLGPKFWVVENHLQTTPTSGLGVAETTPTSVFTIIKYFRY